MTDFAKRVALILCFLLLLLVLASIVYYRSLAFLPFAVGALIGVATNVLKVFLLDRSLQKFITMEKDKATNYIILQNLLRFLLAGVVLVLSAVLPFISLWGAAAGILTWPIATRIMSYVLNREKSHNRAGASEAGGD